MPFTVVCMIDTLFDYDFFDALGGFTIFTVVLGVRIHLTSKTNEFCYNYFSSSFILEFADYFLIGFIVKFTDFWIITVIKFVFIFEEILIHIFCLNFLC